MSTSHEEKAAVLRALWRDKMHVEPRALELSPPTARDHYAHIWEPAESLMRDLKVFPVGLLRLWTDSPAGHLVFTHRASRYEPGPQPWREGFLESVCYLALRDLLGDKREAMWALFDLLDHLLGSYARADGARFSEGEGVTGALGRLARRFRRVHELGYGHDELGARTAEDYFQRTLWLYLAEPRRLNALEPLAYKLYAHGLMQEAVYR